MTTGGARTAPAPVPATGSRPARSAARTVTAMVVRQVRRGTAIVGVVCGVLVGIVVVQYRGLGGAAGLAGLSVLADNPAIRTLFGPPVALDDPGGFTVWRTGTLLAVLVGVWAALTATRVTRGEEEAGRWDLLLAGRIGLRSLVTRHLVVLLAAAAVPGAAVSAGLLLTGARGPGAVLFGTALAGTGMTGAALGLLAAQLLPERRAASGLAVGVLVAGLLLRMVADGMPPLGWLQWITPFGVIGRIAPFGEDRVLPLLALAALVALPGALGVSLAAGRDVGGGRLSAPDRRPPRGRLLSSLSGFAVYRTSRPMLSWGAGLAAYLLLIGLLARAMVQFLHDNPLFARLAAEAGLVQLGSVEGYVAALFGILGIPLGGFAVGRVAATAADELAGRLPLLYSRPVSRTRWVATEAATVAVGTVVLAGVAGLAMWVGTTWVGAGLGLGDALAGAVSVVPVALLCLGAALAALGWAPAAVLPVGLLPAAGGYLVLVLADALRWPEWVRWCSPFAHLAPVPAAPVNGAGTAGMLAVALLLGAAGVLRYAHRDLRA